ncbi:MAG: septal ring lytic transglycosylase RlpA family protein, partial [Pseudomonadota bacterium]
SVQTQQTARTGKPLTLSRVQASRDAQIREERGRAGVYMDGFDGQPTANGEIFDETAMTAAHPSLPLPSLVQVINEDNSREVVVRVNDRGPFDGKRVLELSPRAASVLGVQKGGSAAVRIRYLGPAPVQQNPETYASTRIEDEALPPVQTAPTPVLPPVQPQPVPTTRPAPVRVASLSVGSAAPAGNVFIQAGAFSDIANAQRLSTDIGGSLPVKIEEARVNGGDFFRVLVGPFPTRDMAERERQDLSRSGIVDGFLTTR